MNVDERGFDEVEDRDIGDGVSRRVYASVQGSVPGVVCVCELSTDRCMVTPLLRKSLTRKTLLMISLPRLSKTRTFHIGSPFSLRREVVGDPGAVSPFAVEDWSWLRLKIRSMDA